MSYRPPWALTCTPPSLSDSVLRMLIRMVIYIHIYIIRAIVSVLFLSLSVIGMCLPPAYWLYLCQALHLLVQM